MLKIYQLDPRHEHLLKDHWSGYVWIQPIKRTEKYKGRIVFVDDLGKVLEQSTKRHADKRRLYPWLMSFKRVGYIFSNTNIVKLYPCAEPSVENAATASKIKADEIAKQKCDARLKALQKRFGSDYTIKPKRIIKDPGSRINQKLWLWAFENKELNLRFEHIYSFVEYGYVEKDVESRDGSVKVKTIFAGMRVGKSRRAFSEYYGLSYKSLQQLASGKIDKYKGWTRLRDPRKISKSEAEQMKWQLEKQKEKQNE